MISTSARGFKTAPAAASSTPTAPTTTTTASSPHNDYLLRSILSAFARSNFDECAAHFRSADEPILPFVRHLPLDAIIARFPASRQFLEAIYFRLSVSPSTVNTLEDGTCGLSKDDVRLLHCSVSVKEVVNYIADAQDRNEDERAKSHCYALLTSIARLDTSSIAMLRRYYCLLENAFQTLGDNSLICSSTDRPAASWDALVMKMETLRKSTKFCMEKVRNGSSTNNSSRSQSLLANAKATLLPSSSSLTASPTPLLIGDLTLRDVEDRLMLAVSAFPHVDYLVNTELPAIRALASQLKTRMDADKRLLLLVNELKPRSRVSWSVAQSPTGGEKGRNDRLVKMADLLHRYKRAIGQALEWISPGSLESLSASQLSESLLSLSFTGDGCSDIVTSSLGEYTTSPSTKLLNVNNSENNSKKATNTTSSSSNSSVENSNLEEPVAVVDKALHRSASAQITPSETSCGNIVLCDNNRRSSCNDAPLSDGNDNGNGIPRHQQIPVLKLSGVEDISLGDVRPSILIERYTALYTEQRMQLLDAMDDLRELNNLEPLKVRLVLSVVVLAFRQSIVKLITVRDQAFALAGFKVSDPTSNEFATSFSAALRRSCGTYPIDDVKKSVMALVLEAVSNFPRLTSLPALQSFVNDCVRLAWCLSVQQPSFVISHSATTFDPCLHERFYASTAHSDAIKSYIWPALCLGCEAGPVICKAVVET